MLLSHWLLHFGHVVYVAEHYGDSTLWHECDQWPEGEKRREGKGTRVPMFLQGHIPVM